MQPRKPEVHGAIEALINRSFRRSIRTLSRFADTAEDRFAFLRLDKNEYLWPFPEELLQQFRTAINSEALTAYPELGPLYRALADYSGVAAEQVYVAAGSDMAIRSIYESTIESGDNVVLPRPAYAMFSVYAEMFGAVAKSVQLRDDWSLDTDALGAAVDKHTRFVVVENPAGVTGTGIDSEALRSLAAFLLDRGILLLVDEVYHYVDRDRGETQELVELYPNVIIIRSFSKSHGLAGMRLGYLIGSPKIVAYVARTRPMHEVASLTALAALWVLSHPEVLAAFRLEIRESRRVLCSELARLGIRYRADRGNFVLAFLPQEEHPDLQRKLREDHGIILRRPFADDPVRGWVRITLPPPHECQRLAGALEECLAGQPSGPKPASLSQLAAYHRSAEQ